MESAGAIIASINRPKRKPRSKGIPYAEKTRHLFNKMFHQKYKTPQAMSRFIESLEPRMQADMWIKVNPAQRQPQALTIEDRMTDEQLLRAYGLKTADGTK